MAVGLAICTESFLRWKNILVRHVIHDGHPDGIVRGCLLHIGYSVALTLLGSALVRSLTHHALAGSFRLLASAEVCQPDALLHLACKVSICKRYSVL